jgi:hypothetical protein
MNLSNFNLILVFWLHSPWRLEAKKVLGGGRPGRKERRRRTLKKREKLQLEKGKKW